jgi:hypothetical protein
MLFLWQAEEAMGAVGRLKAEAEAQLVLVKNVAENAWRDTSHAMLHAAREAHRALQTAARATAAAAREVRACADLVWSRLCGQHLTPLSPVCVCDTVL